MQSDNYATFGWRWSVEKSLFTDKKFYSIETIHNRQNNSVTEKGHQRIMTEKTIDRKKSPKLLTKSSMECVPAMDGFIISAPGRGNAIRVFTRIPWRSNSSPQGSWFQLVLDLEPTGLQNRHRFSHSVLNKLAETLLFSIKKFRSTFRPIFALMCMWMNRMPVFGVMNNSNQYI